MRPWRRGTSVKASRIRRGRSAPRRPKWRCDSPAPSSRIQAPPGAAVTAASTASLGIPFNSEANLPQHRSWKVSWGLADQYFGRKRSSVPDSTRLRYMALRACTRLCCSNAKTIFIPLPPKPISPTESSPQQGFSTQVTNDLEGSLVHASSLPEKGLNAHRPIRL